MRVPKPLAWLTLGLAAALGTAAPMVWIVTRPTVAAGTVPATRPAGQEQAPMARLDPHRSEQPAIDVHTARLADQPAPLAEPMLIRVRIPSIGVSARVVPVGIDDTTGSMQVPSDVRSVGWYRFGAVPGRAGAAILVGHVDSATQGEGVFFRLQGVPIGAAVKVDLVGGVSVPFRVVARRVYPKTRLPDSAFERTGRPLLVLITCGGPFDPATRRYRDNIVVYAVPT